MKTTFSNGTNRGMTLLEAMVVIFLLFMLAIVLLPVLASRYRRESRISCNNQLKQIGIAFRVWEGDNNDKYPMGISITNGGAMEAVLSGNPLPVFQVMSNELSDPKILICPQDESCHWATNFNFALTPKNVSYFINPNGKEANPEDIMSGDDNFEVGRIPVKSGLLEIPSNTPIAWSAARHKFSGNILLADGSVQGMSNSGLASLVHSTNFTAMHLAIP